jgi:hypothetical protein
VALGFSPGGGWCGAVACGGWRRWHVVGWRKEMTCCRGLHGPSMSKLCGLSVEDLGRVQRTNGPKMKKRIGIWITNFGLLIWNLKMICHSCMSREFLSELDKYSYRR